MIDMILKWLYQNSAAIIISSLISLLISMMYYRKGSVTGTNGKTTVATLLYNTFRYFGYKVGLVSTVCNYIDDQPVPTEHTTPDPITLNRLLGEMADSGCKYAFMEVSSH